MPTPRNVNGNSKGEGVSKVQLFEQNGISGGVGVGAQFKNLCEGYGYFLEQHISPLPPTLYYLNT